MSNIKFYMANDNKNGVHFGSSSLTDLCESVAKLLGCEKLVYEKDSGVGKLVGKIKDSTGKLVDHAVRITITYLNTDGKYIRSSGRESDFKKI